MAAEAVKPSTSRARDTASASVQATLAGAEGTVPRALGALAEEEAVEEAEAEEVEEEAEEEEAVVRALL